MCIAFIYRGGMITLHLGALSRLCFVFSTKFCSLEQEKKRSEKRSSVSKTFWKEREKKRKKRYASCLKCTDFCSFKATCDLQIIKFKRRRVLFFFKKQTIFLIENSCLLRCLRVLTFKVSMRQDSI